MNAEPTPCVIPLGAGVHCMDGYGGSLTLLIVDPLARRLSHVVVQDGGVPAIAHLVPIARIAETTSNSVMLDCTQAALAAIEPFAEERYISSHAADYEAFYAVDPFATFEAAYIPLVTEHIPPGALAIGRDAQAVASDGPASHLTALVVDPVSGDIGSIVVRVGHWLTSGEQMIPIAAVERIDSGILYLKLARDQIAVNY